jgi:diamine N-acetyltransferase
MTSKHSIRHAGPADAGQLAALAEATFRDTFGGDNTAANMDLHCRASYGESVQRAELRNPGMVTLLCAEGEDPIAFAQLRWSEAPACVSAHRPGEILRLYVARRWHGKGVAQDLMRACIDALADRGCDVAWLGVWERNPRAIAFYEKFGFVAVGDHVFPLGEDPQRDVIMACPIDPRSAKTGTIRHG